MSKNTPNKINCLKEIQESLIKNHNKIACGGGKCSDTLHMCVVIFKGGVLMIVFNSLY